MSAGLRTSTETAIPILTIIKNVVNTDLLRLLTIAGFCVMPMLMSAQMDSTSHRLDEVQVVDSRKHHTVASTAPLYVMDHGEMVRLGVTDMADALPRLPVSR